MRALMAALAWYRRRPAAAKASAQRAGRRLRPEPAAGWAWVGWDMETTLLASQNGSAGSTRLPTLLPCNTNARSKAGNVVHRQRGTRTTSASVPERGLVSG